MTENKRFERVYGDIEVVCIDHDSIDEDRFFDDEDYDKFVKSLNELHEENKQLKKDRNELFIRERDARNDWRKLKYENEELKEQLADANELNGIYVDFLVDKGFELSDVVEWSKRS